MSKIQAQVNILSLTLEKQLGKMISFQFTQRGQKLCLYNFSRKNQKPPTASNFRSSYQQIIKNEHNRVNLKYKKHSFEFLILKKKSTIRNTSKFLPSYANILITLEFQQQYNKTMQRFIKQETQKKKKHITTKHQHHRNFFLSVYFSLPSTSILHVLVLLLNLLLFKSLKFIILEIQSNQKHTLNPQPQKNQRQTSQATKEIAVAFF
eukprot:TRINITY_DN5435_c0_g1_i5.p1 TRINITY_DN5435_c0_g1~~TRINITY_DN5435_c0_g1_i5.p1  ORF type:complete len:207 (+),score=-15.18 TRINITY_DN5435_c0_g1_i5:741-1361(+)